MVEKSPALLTVLIETKVSRWFVAGIRPGGDVVPLVKSAEGNLAFDPQNDEEEKVTFLRHRLSGVLQIACDRLWARQMKPSRIIFITDREFDRHDPELTQRVADHFVEWMSRPPVAFFLSVAGWPADTAESSMRPLAGEVEPDTNTTLDHALPRLIELLGHAESWELAPNKSAT